MIDIYKINSQIDELALKLISLSPDDTNTTEAMLIKNDIVILAMKPFKVGNVNNKKAEDGSELVYCPFGKIRNWISVDVIQNTLLELISTRTDKETNKMIWSFDIKRNQSFMATFYSLLHWRRKDVLIDGEVKNRQQAGVDVVNLDRPIDEENDLTLADTIQDNSELVEEQILESEEEETMRVKFAQIIERFAKGFQDNDLNNSENRKRALYFPGFFTYFRTSDIKLGTKEITERNAVEVTKKDKWIKTYDAEFYQTIAIKYDKELFKYMLLEMLQYLMIGRFASMKDIVRNTLKPEMDLNKKQENIASFYNVTRQTIATFLKKYELLEEMILKNPYQ